MPWIRRVSSTTCDMSLTLGTNFNAGVLCLFLQTRLVLFPRTKDSQNLDICLWYPGVRVAFVDMCMHGLHLHGCKHAGIHILYLHVICGMFRPIEGVQLTSGARSLRAHGWRWAKQWLRPGGQVAMRIRDLRRWAEDQCPDPDWCPMPNAQA